MGQLRVDFYPTTPHYIGLYPFVCPQLIVCYPHIEIGNMLHTVRGTSKTTFDLLRSSQGLQPQVWLNERYVTLQMDQFPDWPW
jgi:hypothetical protein